MISRGSLLKMESPILNELGMLPCYIEDVCVVFENKEMLVASLTVRKLYSESSGLVIALI